jgi:hypothetical protein
MPILISSQRRLASAGSAARMRIRASTKTLTAVDTMSFRSIDAGTEVTYTAEFTVQGPSPSPRPAVQARLRAARPKGADRHAHSAKRAMTQPAPAAHEPTPGPVGLTDPAQGPSVRQRGLKIEHIYIGGSGSYRVRDPTRGHRKRCGKPAPGGPPMPFKRA